MADDDRGADVLTLPTINLSPPGSDPDGDDVPTLPEPPDTAPPPDFTLPFLLPEDEEDDGEYDPDDAAGEMVAEAASGTGTPARATASLAMVTMAAIAVAALRGTWSVAAYLKARREHHDAVADKAREAADKQKVANAEKASKGRVQSGPEFGRGAAKGGGRGGSSGGSGGGSGRGAFGQQKSSGKGGGRTPAGNGSAGTGGRGAGPKGQKGPGSRNDSGGPGRRDSKSPGRRDSRSSGSGSTGAGGKGSANKSPKNGKSPSSPASSPALERARGRQERKGASHAARLERRAARQAARTAGRERRREEKARQAEARRAEKEAESKGDDEDRTTLGQAVAETARKRLKKRRKNLAPPVLSTVKKRKKRKKKPKPKPGSGSGSKPGSSSGTGAASSGPGKKSGKKSGKKASGSKKPKTSGTGASKKPWWKRRRRKKPGGWKAGPWTYRGRRRRGKRRSTDPGAMPGDDGEWLKPPPGWDVSYTVTTEREPAPRRPRGAIGTGQKGLPAGKSSEVTPTRTEPKESPIVMGPAAAVGEVGDTQFVDADLTVYDLIDSDEDMGEQILQGVDHMRVVASKCEGLRTGLENLYAMCLEKKVPGVLVKWCIRLIERAGSVMDKAEALAASLPRASEAILTARDVAVEADKRRADAVKDAGHVAPAEREYHDRSGV
ncbi:hypothetical protein ACM01_14970 [Streptomyces viridochromogenes]|uniref:Uncharacterized protein n=1 Tax=Streptomyces viridochromogenes TaxID=1938 RepID=A0A0J7ZEF5_STRVR|nr:hypothetical protein [Streptomyces viridochromogenes]KMS74219.1 hypothetical protein ACM01_14970 [Streptomyces viridochromogenes]